ncbi:uncharacterized protein VNE69_01252 [Vairimorpha necatrix]|uniref:Uncharacterized protein n=1 Tax=Vairimorpha necatrix TaxID=6039 RepID=A0AAX4J8K6_9MICR
MSSENNSNLFDDSDATLLYTKVEDKNPLTEILDRMNGLSLAALSPQKQDISIADSTTEIEINEENKEEDVVYLQCFVKTIRNLQKKFNKLLKNKFVHKETLNGIYEKLQQGDQESVKKSLENILEKKTIKNIKQTEMYNFIHLTFPMLYKEIIGNLENLDVLKKAIFDSSKTILEKYHEDTEKIKKNEEDFKNQIMKFKLETENILNLTNSNRVDTSKTNINSNVMDRLSIDEFFNDLTKKIKDLFKDLQNFKKENESLKNNSEIEDLKKQLEDKKSTIKQLQSQNISFSEVITKVDTTNIKLKKECVILGTEYKKVVDSLKSKNSIIEKQKKLLEVLQTQVGKKQNFPIDELKKKIEKLKHKIENENSEEKIYKLRKEKEDYLKRIKDYEELNKKM